MPAREPFEEIPVATTGELLELLRLSGDLWRKKKTFTETVITFPLLLTYYHVRLAGYLLQSIRLLLRVERLERVRL